MISQVTIIAPGLLGASLGKALHANQLAERITIWARRAETRLDAADQDWCHNAAETPECAVAGARIVVICTPVEAIAPMVARIAAHLPDDAIVTDVGSTKSLIARVCTQTLQATAATFVGSHPMAGSEKTGMRNADADLFRGKPCLVTPLPETSEPAVRAVVAFWRNLGMEVASLNPEKHDEIVAHVSHLPHVLASVLSAQLGTRDASWRHFSGNGLADTTRIAAGSPALWKSILEQNREEVLRALDGFDTELQSLRSALANEDWFTVLNLLERGKAFRDKLTPVRRDGGPEHTP